MFILTLFSLYFRQNIVFHEKTKSMFLKENENNDENIKLIKSQCHPGHLVIESMSSPRLIQTHFPLSLLPKGVYKKNCKVFFFIDKIINIIIIIKHVLIYYLLTINSNIKGIYFLSINF